MRPRAGSPRAAEAILLPLTVGLVAVAGLWPADTATLVGIAILVVAVGAWLVVTGQLVRRGRGSGVPLAQRTLPRLVFGQLTTLPAIAAGALLASSAIPGLDPVLIAVGGGLAGGPFLAALLDPRRHASGGRPRCRPSRPHRPARPWPRRVRRTPRRRTRPGSSCRARRCA